MAERTFALVGRSMWMCLGMVSLLVEHCEDPIGAALDGNVDLHDFDVLWVEEVSACLGSGSSPQ